MLAEQASGLGAAGMQNIASSAAAPTSAFGNFVGQTGQNLAAAGQGIKNLTGFGPQGVSGIGPAATSFAEPVTAKGMTALGVGAMGISDLDAQQDYLNSQQNAQNSANSEYNQQMAIIDSNRKRAEEAMRANPYKFAMGGNVATYAEGGMPPRFLSGGGDGMSDSIKATINDKQEARLADGEFVIPADVVSHLGNGSSKAGAKRLYSMMDKVRLARTGNKKQGKEINPMKYMPA
jgi:hypothetical protein